MDGLDLTLIQVDLIQMDDYPADSYAIGPTVSLLFQLLLEAPDDIYTFKFCPTDPHIIAGGCINGQVVLWDISKHADRLKTQRGGNKRKTLNTLVRPLLVRRLLPVSSF